MLFISQLIVYWLWYLNVNKLHAAPSCAFTVLSVDHSFGSSVDGKYFNFNNIDVDNILGRSDWSVESFTVKKNINTNVRVILWRNNNGGSVGDGHGRKHPFEDANPNDWSKDDVISFQSSDCQAHGAPFHIISAGTHGSADCTKLQIEEQPYHGGNDQKFIIQHINNDWYQIKCGNDVNQCWELVEDPFVTDREYLERAGCDSSKKGQKFQFTALGHNTFTIAVETILSEDIWSSNLLDDEGDGFRHVAAKSGTGSQLFGSNCPSERWIITRTEEELIDGDYYMLNLNSDKSIDCSASSNKVVQWSFHGQSNQQFHISHIDAEYYGISCVGQINQCWDLQRAGDPWPIVYQTCDSSLNDQQWYFHDLGNEEYAIKVRNYGRILDVPGWSTNDGVQLIGWDDSHYGNNQVFKLTPTTVQDGYYYIENVHDDNAWAVECWYGIAMIYYPDHYWSQKLYISNQGHNQYSIKCDHNGKYFTMSEATANGKVNLENWAGTNNQLFRFEFNKISGDEVWKIISVESNLLLEIPGLYPGMWYPQALTQIGQFTEITDQFWEQFPDEVYAVNHQKWKLWPYTYTAYFASDTKHHSDYDSC